MPSIAIARGLVSAMTTPSAADVFVMSAKFGTFGMVLATQSGCFRMIVTICVSPGLRRPWGVSPDDHSLVRRSHQEKPACRIRPERKSWTPICPLASWSRRRRPQRHLRPVHCCPAWTIPQPSQARTASALFGAAALVHQLRTANTIRQTAEMPSGGQDPTPDEIRQRCVAVRTGWSEEEYRRRAGEVDRRHWEVPTVAVAEVEAASAKTFVHGVADAPLGQSA